MFGGVWLGLVVSGTFWGLSEGCLGGQVVFGWCVVVSWCCLRVYSWCLGSVLGWSGAVRGVSLGFWWCLGGCWVVFQTIFQIRAGHTGIQNPGSDRVNDCRNYFSML